MSSGKSKKGKKKKNKKPEIHVEQYLLNYGINWRRNEINISQENVQELKKYHEILTAQAGKDWHELLKQVAAFTKRFQLYDAECKENEKEMEIQIMEAEATAAATVVTAEVQTAEQNTILKNTDDVMRAKNEELFELFRYIALGRHELQEQIVGYTASLLQEDEEFSKNFGFTEQLVGNQQGILDEMGVKYLEQIKSEALEDQINKFTRSAWKVIFERVKLQLETEQQSQEVAKEVQCVSLMGTRNSLLTREIKKFTEEFLTSIKAKLPASHFSRKLPPLSDDVDKYRFDFLKGGKSKDRLYPYMYGVRISPELQRICGIGPDESHHAVTSSLYPEVTQPKQTVSKSPDIIRRKTTSGMKGYRRWPVAWNDIQKVVQKTETVNKDDGCA